MAAIPGILVACDASAKRLYVVSKVCDGPINKGDVVLGAYADAADALRNAEAARKLLRARKVGFSIEITTVTLGADVDLGSPHWDTE